eukprot:scaffold12782_cov129-Isochrysis_galbana.AAC.2
MVHFAVGSRDSARRARLRARVRFRGGLACCARHRCVRLPLCGRTRQRFVGLHVGHQRRRQIRSRKAIRPRMGCAKDIFIDLSEQGEPANSVAGGVRRTSLIAMRCCGCCGGGRAPRADSTAARS